MYDPKDSNEYLKKAISDFEGSEQLREMQVGEAYYLCENTKIMSRQKLMYARDAATQTDYLIEDPYKANNKLANGYYKILVDQKVQYLLGKPVLIADKVGSRDVMQLLGKKTQTTLKRIAKDAAKKGIGWAQAYINDEGEFRLMRIPSEQVIPVYKADDADELDFVIRYYTVCVEGKDGKPRDVTQVEVWDEINVYIYQQDPDSGIYAEVSRRPHIKSVVRYGEQTAYGSEEEAAAAAEANAEFFSWGEVPFIPLYNNDERIYDLKEVRGLLDNYDVIVSDFANNLEDMQDVYWVLKGYHGENLSKFLDEVRRYKTLKVSEEGSATTETVEIPTVAREAMLGILNDNIFKFGRGVDTSQTGDGNLTNIVIRARFANLDLKASEFETQVTEFIDEVVELLNRYLEINDQPQLEDYEVTFNRSMIINETEMLAANAGQQGAISEYTRLNNHPWVDDVSDEIEKIEEEKSEVVIPEIPEITIPTFPPLTPPAAGQQAGQAAAAEKQLPFLPEAGKS